MSTVATQAVVAEELNDLAEAVARGEDLNAEGPRERLARMVASLQLLLSEHVLDERGRCPTCGRRRCPTAGVLTVYAGAWLTTASLRRSPAARHAARPDDSAVPSSAPVPTLPAVETRA